jgi:hypothetical protein
VNMISSVAGPIVKSVVTPHVEELKKVFAGLRRTHQTGQRTQVQRPACVSSVPGLPTGSRLADDVQICRPEDALTAAGSTLGLWGMTH